MRIAMKINTPAKVASGMFFSSATAGTSTTTTAAALRPASCVRPPADATTALHGGLALTAKEPARMLPAPTPRKSRPTSTSPPSCSAKARVVAADWMITTTATTSVQPLVMGRRCTTALTRWSVEPLVAGSPNRSGNWWTTMITATPARIR